MTRRAALALGAVLVVAFAAYGSFVPLRLEPVPLDEAVRRFAATPFIPLHRASKSDFITNVLLFVPIGFFVLGAIANRSRRAAFTWLTPAVLLCALVSIAIEFGQIFVRGRTPSWNDVLAETLGAAIGAGLWVAGGSVAVDWLAPLRRSASAEDRLFRLLGAYTFVWLVLALLPFDFTIRPQELAEKFRAGRILLQPLGPHASLEDSLTTFVMAVPVGIGALLGARQAGAGRALGFAGGLVLVLFVEAAQAISVTRTADVTDFFLNAAGVGAGVAVASRVLDRSGSGLPQRFRLWPFAALAVWCALLAARHWSPFDFIADGAFIQRRLPGMLQVPFHNYYWAFAPDALIEATTKVLMGVPVGALLQWVWAPERRLLRVVHVVGIAVSSLLLFTAIELGQLMLPSRYPDQTDIYLGAGGALIGAWIVRLISPAAGRNVAASAPPPPADSSRESEPRRFQPLG